MLDKKLLETTLIEIDKLRTQIFALNEEVDINHIHYKSLLNLLHYRILRSKDRRELQEKLFSLSLSSLGRSFAHVAWSIDTLYQQIESSLHTHLDTNTSDKFSSQLTIQDALQLNILNSSLLFGGKTTAQFSRQKTAIMVTLPSNAADNDGALIHDLAKVGVNAFRINTAHDDSATWSAMAAIIKEINLSYDNDSKIKIFIDLAGPKIRTGKIRKINTPVVIGSNKVSKQVHIFHSKERDTISEHLDAVTREKKVAQIVINKKMYKKIKVDSVLKIVDANSKKAFITITALYDDYAEGFIDKKVYLDDSAKIYKKRKLGKILNIQKQTEQIRLKKEDILIISEDDKEGSAALYDENRNLLQNASIPCSFQGIAEHVDRGEKIFIDDGKIGLEVIKVEDKLLTCRVTLAKENGTVLKEEKGINFPDSHILTNALTKNDRENLLYVLDFVNHISLSFCQSAQDVRDLKNLLKEHGREDIGIVTKIETKKALSNMPEILEELLDWQKSAVMIARGDLAIEVGFENLAFVQESLLDICDAAHIPVIWATQVLENQMKNNLPSRAEITDAAMSGRAECVMLNKGAFALNTIGVLKHILHDMHSISKKSRQLLSKETLW